MTLELIIQNFGYPAILLGTFLEDETILIIGGFMAHRGYLSFPAVIACAFLGSLIGDQFYFFIGRNKGLSFLDKRPSMKEKLARFQALFDRHSTLIILSFRFLYGTRTVAPFAIGLSNIRTSRFLLLNTLSAIIWSSALGAAGFFFGQAFELILEDIKRYEIYIISAGGLIIIVRVLYKFLKKRRMLRR